MTDRGTLALVFDDGYAEDYDELWPVLERADAPACFAVVPSWLGDDDRLSADELAELADRGCEVVAHGQRHRFLAPHRVMSDVAAGSERVSLDGHVFPGDDAGVLVGDEYELTDGRRSRTVQVADTGDENGPYVDLERPVEERWSAGDAVLRPTEALIEAEVGECVDALVDFGFDPSTFVFPYDHADARSWRIVREHCDAVANAAVGPLPNPPETAPWNLRRIYLEGDWSTRVEIETYLDEVARTGGLGILAGHSAWSTVSPERVSFAIESARERGIEVATIADAVEAERVGAD